MKKEIAVSTRSCCSSVTLGIFIAALLGLFSGLYAGPYALALARGVSRLFINMLELISIPLIFLSIVSTISGMESLLEMKKVGGRVLFYTVVTTLIASGIGLALFILINPVGKVLTQTATTEPLGTMKSYFSFLENMIPSNIIQLFGNNANVTAIVFFAMLLSIAILSLEQKQRETLHDFFASFFAAILKIASFILLFMPVGVWAFVTVCVHSMSNNTSALITLGWYVACVLLANLIQGFIVLPAMLMIKGISPMEVARGMTEALVTAFFSKSSSTTLPVTVACATKKVGVSQRVASFALPLCATINMNACAAFILITVLFVGMSSGLTFTPLEMGAWIIISTLAAIGNAGVPMGCYFLTSAFLASMDVPLFLLGAILPIYTLIDMVETALNVWSDACVAIVVDKDLKEK